MAYTTTPRIFNWVAPLFLAIFFLQPSAQAQLTGTYTIGGTAPDYATISAAVFDLSTNGVSGPVIMNIRDGVYTEKISISEISGASNVNTITFTSESLDSTAVIWEAAGTSGSNYTLRLNLADYLRFQFIHFRYTDSTFPRVLDFIGGAANAVENVEVSNCIIEGRTYASLSEQRAAIYLTESDSVRFSKCVIDRGSMGIRAYRSNYLFVNDCYVYRSYYGMDLEECNYVHVTNNLVDFQFNRFFYAETCQNLWVSENDFTSTGSMLTGIEFRYCSDTMKVTQNSIYMSDGDFGIRFFQSDATASNPSKIINNYILVNGPGADNGMILDQSDYINVYHNTSKVYGANSTESSLSLLGPSTGINVVNNILTNYNSGSATIVGNNVTVSSMDYNVLYTTDAVLGDWKGTSANDLSAWQLASSMDLNSLEMNPVFLNDTLPDVTQVLLNDLGTPLASVPNDIYDSIRHLITPDIGCVEWSPKYLDISLLNAEIGLTFCGNSDSVYLRFINLGIDTVTTATIDWTVNGTSQTAFSWSGSVPQGDTTAPFSVGFYDFLDQTEYDITFTSSNPNGSPDEDVDNDSIVLLDQYVRLNGTYTIGGTTPDFPTIDSAVSALAFYGVCGPVVMNIRSGTYNEQLYLLGSNGFAGTSAVNTITFRSESLDSTDVEITAAPVSFPYGTFTISNVNHIILEHLTISTTGSPDANAVSIGGRSNIVRNCVLKGLATGTNTLQSTVSFYSNQGKVENCRIEKGTYGIQLGGPDSIELRNNLLIDQILGGILIINATYISVDGNTIKRWGNSGYIEGIKVDNSDEGIEVINNQIHMPYGGVGVFFNLCYYTSAERGLVANNSIYLGDQGSSANYGIRVTNCDFLNVFHNSVNAKNSHAESRSFYHTGAGNALSLLNNIFASDGTGFCVDIQGLGVIEQADYNNLIATNGSNTGYYFANYSTLANWTGATTLDSNSVAILPPFINDSNLHWKSYAYDRLGTPTSEVLTDMDGETRDVLNPDIGADEWIGPQDDAGVMTIDNNTYCEDSVYVTINGYGYDTLTSALINWKVDGILQPSFAWTGSVLHDSISQSINIGPFVMTGNNSYNIEVWTSLPNGSVDLCPDNDSTSVVHAAGLMGTYTVGGATPDYSTISLAVNDLHDRGICGPVTFNLRDGVYNEQVEINAIVGSSAINTITFTSESADSSAVVWNYDAGAVNDYIVKLTYSEFIHFEQITFKSLDVFYGRIFWLNGNTRNIFIGNCELEGPVITSNTFSQADLVYLSGSGSSTNTGTNVMNCRITNGDFGYRCAAGFGLVAQGNVFVDQFAGAIRYSSADGLTITQNHMSSNTLESSYRAINITGTAEILRNTIEMVNGSYGIFVVGTNDPSDTAHIENNFVTIEGTTGTAVGIYPILTPNLRIFHNSVHITRPGGSSIALELPSSTGDGIHIINNNLVNTGGGYAVTYVSDGFIDVMDHNNYFTTGSILASDINGNIPDLPGLLTGGRNANSKSLNPEFASTTDLHICNQYLNNAGMPVSTSDDIDGETRNTLTPDIGADEFLMATLELPEDTIMCSPATLDAKNTGATYLWSTSETAQTISVSVEDTVTLQVTLGCGVTFDTLIVNLDFPLAIDLGNDTVRCDSNHFLLDAGIHPDAAYAWYSSAGAGPTTQTNNVTSTDTVWVEVSNTCGTYTDTALVTLPLDFTVDLGNDSSICQGDTVIVDAGNPSMSYFWSTSETTQTIEAYSDTLFWVVVTDGYGCSNTDTMSLSLYPLTLVFDTVTICANQNHVFFNDTLTSAGLYLDTMFNLAGCDSVITSLLLNVKDTTHHAYSASTCDYYLFGGDSLISSGTYTDTLTNSLGCDSIVELSLTVNYSKDTVINLSSCGFYDFNGDTLLNSGTFYDTIPLTTGCDSTVTLLLTILSGSSTPVAVSICSGDSLFLGGDFRNTAGNYYDTLIAQNTCDSVIVSTLTILPVQSDSINMSICSGDSVLLGGAYRLTGGIYTDSMTNQNGCDSLIITTLTLKTVYLDTIQVQLCDGDSIFTGGAFQQTNGFYTDTMTSTNGCDSIQITELMINPVHFIQLNATICSGDSLFIGGTYQFQTGVYLDSLSTINGCDSVIETALTVLATSSVNLFQTICSGDSVAFTSGWETTTGTYVDTLTNTLGCDSIVTLDLTVLNKSYDTIVVSTCTPYTVPSGDETHLATGMYLDTLINAAGCDSLITIDLTILSPSATVDIITACEQHTWIDGITYTASNNSATHTLTNGDGCDSTITLNLTIVNSTTGTDVISVCGSYLWTDGNTYTTSNNTATDTLIDANGCDSVVTLNLTILNTNAGTDVISACETYTWIDGNTYTNSNNSATTALIGANGCDSIVTLDLTILNASTGTDDIMACGSYTWTDGNTYNASNNTATQTLTGSNGCDSVVTLNLTIETVDVSVTEIGSTLTANLNNASYQWLDCDNLFAELSGETAQSFTAIENGLYSVAVTSGNCTDTSSCFGITISGTDLLISGGIIKIYPNPNRGSFTIKTDQIYQELKIEVVDPSGRLVHSSRANNVLIRDVELKNTSQGVYFVKIFANGENITVHRITVF